MFKRLLLLISIVGCFGAQLTSHAVVKKASAKHGAVAKKLPAKKVVAKKRVVKKVAPKKVARKPVAKKRCVVGVGTLLASVIESEQSLNKLLRALRKVSPNDPNIMFLQMAIEFLRDAEVRMRFSH